MAKPTGRGASLLVFGVIVVLAALAGLAVILYNRSHDGAPNHAAAPAATSASPTPTPTKSLPYDKAKVEKLAADFTSAMYSQSYTDPTPNTWYWAIKPYTTKAYYKDATAGIDPTDGGSLAAQMEKDHQEQTASVEATYIKMRGSDILVYVKFSTDTSATSGDVSSDDSSVLTIVKQGAGYKVDGVDKRGDKDYEQFFDDAHDDGEDSSAQA